MIAKGARGLYWQAFKLMKSPGTKIVLVVDQFEELFTQPSEEERQHFIDLLVVAATHPQSPVIVIVTLRADFYDRLMNDPELRKLIETPSKKIHSRFVPPMDIDELRTVIEQPADLPGVKLSFDEDLVGDLLFETRGQAGALPLLEFTLDQLFQRRRGQQLTRQAYEDIGGVKGALKNQAESTFTTLSEECRQLVRVLFLRLIDPGMTEQDTTRRRATLTELTLPDPEQTRLLRSVVDTFIDARLLTTNKIGESATIEVSHEALIREWPLLADWLPVARKDIRFQQSLSKDVREWEQRKGKQMQSRDLLYRGDKLKEAREWAGRNTPSKQEADFIRASATQRTLSLVSLIVVVLLLISSVGITGWNVLHQPPSKTLVTTLQDSAVGSLRYCIDNAPTRSTITFAPDLRGTIELMGGSLVFAGGRQLTIRGPGADQITISGGDTNANLFVAKGATLNMSGLSFKNSKTTIFGFLYNEGALTVSDSIISNNEEDAHNSGYGGGIYNYTTGTLIVMNSTISNNKVISGSVGQGAGINNEGRLNLTGSTIVNNSVSSISGDSYGGGIFNTDTGTAIITNSTISNNSASSGESEGLGGGIANKGKLTVTSSTIANNKAIGPTTFGGGIFNYEAGTLSLTNSTLSNDLASSSTGDGHGGGIDNQANLIVTNSTLSSNKALGHSGYGGAIYNYTAGSIWLAGSTISDNIASNSAGDSAGGGINNGGKLIVVNNTIVDNRAVGKTLNTVGGGIFSKVSPKGTFAIIYFSTIYGNTSGTGGDIWVDPTGSSHLTISSSIVAANRAPDGPDVSGMLISGGYNLIGNYAGAKGFADTDRQVTLADLKIDPTLDNNGGPTQTLALLQGSQAIDAVPLQACRIAVTDVSGHTATITMDQRGNSRPDGSEKMCDTGAYESSY